MIKQPKHPTGVQLTLLALAVGLTWWAMSQKELWSSDMKHNVTTAAQASLLNLSSHFLVRMCTGHKSE